MEYLTETVLSGMVYDLVKNGIQVSTLTLKDKLKRWFINDSDIEILAKQINEISMLEDLSEAAICRKLQQNPTVQSLIVNVHQEQTVKNIKQKHKGSGDNVGGDKVINY
ncbi:GapS6a family protein [Psychrobacter sp. DM4]|uniref:GapS6a family protein n=1 Tax=Psychrobacter sp. DM4 TaxID=3440637 RepID=UPI003F50A573